MNRTLISKVVISAIFIGTYFMANTQTANAAVGITELTSSDWQTNTGNTLTTSTLFSTYSQLGWTPLITANCDDCNNLLSFPANFNTTFNGTSYNGTYVGSNTYFTFGSGSSNYASLSASNPNIPGVHLCAADNSWQLVVWRSENNGNNFRFRYEGTNSTGGSGGSPNIIYEVVFYKNQAYFDVAVGGNARCPTGSSGATNGTSYLATFPTSNNLANRYFRIGEAAPSVSSFTSSQQTPTNSSSSISYSLVMSESVTGLDGTDFENAGTSTGCVFTVSGSGTTYAIGVSSCGEGTLTPRLKANSVTGTFTGPTSATPSATTILIDRTSPTSSSVQAPSNGTYKPTDTPTFTVAFSESVTVTGTPRLTLTVGAITKYANYVSQTDSRTALFRYTVASNTSEFDTDGITLSNSIDLNGGSITDLASNSLTPLTFTPPNTSAVLIAQPPAVPVINSTEAGSGFVKINFSAGAIYGSAITNYQYSTNNGSTWTARSPVDTSTPLTISGLTNGTSYQIRIRAVSAVGVSDSSTTITSTPNAVTISGGSNISTIYKKSASSTAFTASGGVAPYAFTLSTSVSGITISNGVVTAAATVPVGVYSMSIIATDTYTATGTYAITITVIKAIQDSLTVNSTSGVFQVAPSTLTLYSSGGTDTGTVTYSVVAGGTASGCSISGTQLTVSSAGNCKVVATKAATNNYLIAYSDTATITFSQFISYQPVQTQSTPSQIPISGKNSLDTSQVNSVPAVTGVFLVGSTYEINGTGFTGVSRVVIGGADISISSSTSTKIVVNSAGLFPGPLFIECSDGRIGPSPFYFFVP